MVLFSKEDCFTYFQLNEHLSFRQPWVALAEMLTRQTLTSQRTRRMHSKLSARPKEKLMRVTQRLGIPCSCVKIRLRLLSLRITASLRLNFWKARRMTSRCAWRSVKLKSLRRRSSSLKRQVLMQIL